MMNQPYRCIRFPERRGVCAENLAAATPVSKGKTNYTPMVDDTKSGILKHENDNAYRRAFSKALRRFAPPLYATTGSSAELMKLNGLKNLIEVKTDAVMNTIYNRLTPCIKTITKTDAVAFLCALCGSARDGLEIFSFHRHDHSCAEAVRAFFYIKSDA